MIGIVRHCGGTELSTTYNVGSASVVMTRKDGRELYHTVVINLLDATKSSAVEVARVVVVAVALAVDTTVHTSRVGAPDVRPCNVSQLDRTD